MVELDEVVQNILSSYDEKCYSAVLACIKRSMAVLRRRLCSSGKAGALSVDQVRMKFFSIILVRTLGSSDCVIKDSVLSLLFTAIFSS